MEESGPASWVSSLFLKPSSYPGIGDFLPSSYPGIGDFLLSEHHFKMSLKSAVLTLGQPGAGAHFR